MTHDDITAALHREALDLCGWVDGTKTQGDPPYWILWGDDPRAPLAGPQMHPPSLDDLRPGLREMAAEALGMQFVEHVPLHCSAPIFWCDDSDRHWHAAPQNVTVDRWWPDQNADQAMRLFRLRPALTLVYVRHINPEAVGPQEAARWLLSSCPLDLLPSVLTVAALRAAAEGAR